MSPSGPAGGDLAASYPNPEVIGLSHCVAGGDLSGTMDAPTVIGLAAVIAGQAADAIALTRLAPLRSGSGALDGTGIFTFGVPAGTAAAVVSWLVAPGTGILFAAQLDATTWQAVSSAGAADTGAIVTYISF